jgi:hypothetical protein
MKAVCKDADSKEEGGYRSTQLSLDHSQGLLPGTLPGGVECIHFKPFVEQSSAPGLRIIFAAG